MGCIRKLVSDLFGKRLKNLVESNFEQVEMNVAFETSKTIGSYFPFKDNVKKKESESYVVYKLACKVCNECYIGKTARILAHRMKEHGTVGSESACQKHVESDEGHYFDFRDVEIVDRAETDFKLKVKELLHILRQKPSLNTQLNSQSSYNIKTLIIRAYPSSKT